MLIRNDSRPAATGEEVPEWKRRLLELTDGVELEDTSVRDEKIRALDKDKRRLNEKRRLLNKEEAAWQRRWDRTW